jgi:glycerol-3-phosphate acyltransferase PlsY
MILAVHVQASLICILVFLVVLLITRYVSLSSIAAGFTFPLSTIFIFHVSVRSIIVYGMCICVLILVTHQKNIERLMKGKESKVNFFKKKVV